MRTSRRLTPTRYARRSKTLPRAAHEAAAKASDEAYGAAFDTAMATSRNGAYKAHGPRGNEKTPARA